MSHMRYENITLRPAELCDLAELIDIENICFRSDKLSRRSFRYHIQRSHSVVLIAYSQSEDSRPIIGYGLCLLNKGTKLARLYSLAVHPDARGLNLGNKILQALESEAKSRGRIFMRLEVACSNEKAINLYQKAGFKKFGVYHGYYDNHDDALRMQKTIRHYEHSSTSQFLPWYQQSTEFTCGPAALMMAMASISNSIECDRELEIQLWREATTVFMTSGVGGTHPFGLALSAKQRGFNIEVHLNNRTVLFTEGVRSSDKKSVLTLVHNIFLRRCKEASIPIYYQNIEQKLIEDWLNEGARVIILISTYRLDGKKTPHWVMITGVDERCFYVHDPDVDEVNQSPIDCQYLPIAREDFDKMSAFGTLRLRVALTLTSTKKYG